MRAQSGPRLRILGSLLLGAMLVLGGAAAQAGTAAADHTGHAGHASSHHGPDHDGDMTDHASGEPVSDCCSTLACGCGCGPTQPPALRGALLLAPLLSETPAWPAGFDFGAAAPPGRLFRPPA